MSDQPQTTTTVIRCAAVGSKRTTTLQSCTPIYLDSTPRLLIRQLGSASGSLRLSIPDVSTYAAAVCVQANGLAANAKTEIEGSAIAGQSYVEIVHYENGSTSSLASHVQSGSTLIVTGVYFHAA